MHPAHGAEHAQGRDFTQGERKTEAKIAGMSSEYLETVLNAGLKNWVKFNKMFTLTPAGLPMISSHPELYRSYVRYRGAEIMAKSKVQSRKATARLEFSKTMTEAQCEKRSLAGVFHMVSSVLACQQDLLPVEMPATRAAMQSLPPSASLTGNTIFANTKLPRPSGFWRCTCCHK